MNKEILYAPFPSQEDIETLTQGLDIVLLEKKGMPPEEKFGFFIKDKNKIVAGCNGLTYFGELYLDQLWVAPHLRGQGYGTKLMEAVERLGHQKECTMVTTATMDWGGRDFYKKLGYEVEFTRTGYKDNSTCYYLKKEL